MILNGINIDHSIIAHIYFGYRVVQERCCSQSMVTNQHFNLTSGFCNNKVTLSGHQTVIRTKEINDLYWLFDGYTFGDINKKTILGKSGIQRYNRIVREPGLTVQIIL